jgi:SecD-like export protein
MDTSRPRSSGERIAGLALATMLATACTSAPAVTGSPAPTATARAMVNATPTATARPLRSGPAPKDIGCDDIRAGKSPTSGERTLPPPPQPRIAGGDPASQRAITRAADRLAALRSYQFTVDIVGRDITTLQGTTLDFGVKGTVDRSNGFALDAVMGSRLREANGSAAVSSGGSEIKAGDGYVWGTDNVSGDLEPMRDPMTVDTIQLLTPEGSAARYVVPFAAGYTRVGAERHSGVATQHYRASAKGEAAYAKTMEFDGPLTADVWIAADGGHLVGARVTGHTSHVDPTTNIEVDDGFILAFEISRANDPANAVTLPATPLPDPTRPVHAPVDLLLTYDIAPADGRMPTAQDLDDIGVALRTRLNVYERPIKVDFVGLTQVVVTVCATTTPDADRRLISSAGALTVVPLPRERYGTSTHRGPTPLPAVGSEIDPALKPIAPAGGLGLTTAHVDPATGRRGLAFRLGNKASDAFMAYATTHRGEMVAVVLDGVVLATLPIDARTARGNFVFTGDYTEAESHNLASYLYRDPIPFELRPIEDVELPTHG